MQIFTLALWVILISPCHLRAQVAAPKTLQHGALFYSVQSLESAEQIDISLVAKRSPKATPLWQTPLYSIRLRPGVPIVQQAFGIKEIRPSQTHIELIDEKNQKYRVDARTGMMPKAYLISGFDDVLRQAENTSLWKAGLKLFDEDHGFAGTSELYTFLTSAEEATSREDTPRFVLISAISGWFSRRITDFLDHERFPTVELHLRDWLTQWSIEGFKMGEVAKVVNALPGRRFIVIFDNSEASLNLASRLLQEYPDRISSVYLRIVEQKPLPAGAIGFHTAFEVAMHEVRQRRLSEKEAIVIGHALLDEQEPHNIIPAYADCPKDYQACALAPKDLSKVCAQINERIQTICRAR